MQGPFLNGIRWAVSQISAGERKTTWSNRVHRTIQSSSVKRDVELYKLQVCAQRRKSGSQILSIFNIGQHQKFWRYYGKDYFNCHCISESYVNLESFSFIRSGVLWTLVCLKKLICSLMRTNLFNFPSGFLSQVKLSHRLGSPQFRGSWSVHPSMSVYKFITMLNCKEAGLVILWL